MGQAVAEETMKTYNSKREASGPTGMQDGQLTPNKGHLGEAFRRKCWGYRPKAHTRSGSDEKHNVRKN